MSTTLQRIKQFVDYKGLNNSSFERSVGFSNGSFASQLKNNRTIGVDKLENILNEFPELNVDWVLSGRGHMLQGAGKPQLSSNAGVPYYNVDFKSNIDLTAIGQPGQANYFIDFEAYNDCLAWVNATGRSMEPLINHGDIIALKEVENWQEFLLSGEVYAIITKDFRTIKRVRVEDDVDYLTLVPHNTHPDFTKQRLPKSMVNRIFRVKGAVKKFF